MIIWYYTFSVMKGPVIANLKGKEDGVTELLSQYHTTHCDGQGACKSIANVELQSYANIADDSAIIAVLHC